MIYVVEQIGMKPTGLLAAWRYVNILFNDQTGAITTESVPGKPFPNLPCLADYRKNNRPVYTDGLIKETCDFVAHTNYKLIAQDCTPYIIVQTDVNAEKCGYNTVLPTPGLPVLPFRTPPYGLYKFIEYCESADNPEVITVNFYKKNYVGAVSEITNGAGDPVRFNLTNNQEIEYGIIATEAEIALTVDNNFQLSEFYTFDEMEYKVEILLSGAVKFVGMVIPDSCAEPFKEAPYPVVIRATDCLGGLQRVTFPLPLGSIATLKQPLKDVLCYALYMTRLNLDIASVVNLYATNMTAGPNDDPLAMGAINPALFGDTKGQIEKCYGVLEHMCRAWRCFLKQEGGVWRFDRTCERALPTTRKRIYDYTGLFLRSELVSGTKSVGFRQPIDLLDGVEQSIGNAYKRVEVLLDYGSVPANVQNGDFETWDGNNFQFWAKFGGIQIARVERSVLGSQGVVGLNNYACQFINKANASSYIQHDPIPVTEGDKINFKLLTGPNNPAFPANLRIRFQVGSYCLYNDPDPYAPRTYTWENQLATTSYTLERVNNPQFVTISIPEVPISGNLIIQIYGFEYPGVEVPGFYWIDNVGISKNSTQGDYAVTGSLAVSEQLNYYTNKPDMIEIKFGDYENPASTNPMFPPVVSTTPTVQNNIYAIYSKGVYSEKWFEWGVNADAVPFNLANARAGLRINRSPYIQMRNCTLKGKGLSFFDTYSIVVPGSTFNEKAFIPLSGTYSLKYREFSGTLREIIKGNIVSNDVVSPYLPDQLETIIMSDPNSVPILGDQGGIFTEQFTQEFS